MIIDRGAVQSAVEEMEGEPEFDEVIREHYRGKGEDKEGFGLTFETPTQAQEFFVQMALFDADIAIQLVRVAKHDHMGKNFITYFPGWELGLL